MIVRKRILDFVTTHDRKRKMIDDSCQTRIATMISLPCRFPLFLSWDKHFIPTLQRFAKSIYLTSVRVSGGRVAAFQQDIGRCDKRCSLPSKFLERDFGGIVPLIRDIP